MKKKKGKDDRYLKRVADTSKKPNKTVNVEWYNVTSKCDYSQTYELGCYDTVEMLPRLYRVELGFWCPLCRAKFDVELSRFNFTDSMTCFCGTKLMFDEMPKQIRREYNENY